LFGTSAIYPIKNDVIDDDAVDLGDGSNRFKDLYLSGSVIADGSILSTTGTAAAAAIRPNNDINCGIFFPAANTFAVTTDGSEACRVDPFGNLLVGKTNNTLSNDGTIIRAGGEILVTNTSDFAGTFNRLSTDGAIVGFAKDGTTVGSIGADGGRPYFASGGCGVKLGGSDFTPVTSAGATSDNVVNLGSATARFKDLYLSGGAYLGGTGSANKLDDYEEGTWTPTVTTVSGFTVGASPSYSGTYVKIGKKVFIAAKLDFDSSDAVAEGDYVQLGGVPFSPVHAFDGEGVFHVAVNASANRGATGTAYNIGTSLYLWTTHIGSGAQSWVSGVYVQMAFEVS